MAIVYTTGTINQPDAGSVGLAMIEKIRDDVVAHAAWDLVEEFTPASGASRWYVFKCLAAQSGLPNDFYVIAGRTLATGELRFCLAEGYNAGTHTMQYFTNPTSNTSFLLDAQGRRTETYTLSTAVLPNGSVNYWYWIPSGVSTKWWITVSEDGFTAAFNGASNGFVSAGRYIPLSAVTNDMPIQVSGNNSNNGAQYGGITRNPSVPGVSTPGYAGTFLWNGAYLGFRSSLQYNDRLQANQRPVAEVGMTLFPWTTDWTEKYGFALGKLKNVRAGSIAVPGFAFGDAYALGGTLWVPYLPSDYHIWNTGVASS